MKLWLASIGGIPRLPEQPGEYGMELNADERIVAAPTPQAAIEAVRTLGFSDITVTEITADRPGVLWKGHAPGSAGD